MNEELKNVKDLLKAITEADGRIIIVGHNNPDLDSLASAIGLQTLCTALGKEAYIVLDEPEETIEPIVKKVRDDARRTHNIINMRGYSRLKKIPSTLIVTDTSKQDKIVLGDYLSDFQDIIIIDHHNPTEASIQGAKTYIPICKEQDVQNQKVKASSASEIVAQLLLLAKVDCDVDVYTYLYGGIYLDTNRFDKNVGEKTHDTTHKLCAKGANVPAVKELFLADFDEDKIIYNLMFNGSVLKVYQYGLFNSFTVSFTLNRESPETIYKRETLAKAADRMLNYKVDAAFTIGFIDEENIAISARSKGRIDVGKVMHAIGGGGNAQNAATQVNTTAIESLEELLSMAVNEGIFVEGEDITPTDSTVVSRPYQYVKTKPTDKK